MGRDNTRSRRPDRPDRYRHPIPSRQDIVRALEGASGPQSLDALAAALGIAGTRAEQGIENRLRAMVRDGQLLRNRAGQFGLTGHLDVVTGTVLAHRDGYGFLQPDNGGEDIYLSAREMRPLWQGDRVAIHARKGRRGLEGRVAEILSRARAEIVGVLHRDRGIAYVIDSSQRSNEVLIARGHLAKARPGDTVRVGILEYPNERSPAIGKVNSIVGRAGQTGLQTDVALLAHGIPHEWNDAVLAEAAVVPDAVPASALHGREDLRDLPLVTIDGADARDFDDAVYCEPLGKGWRLFVAIADVAHYVAPGSAIDQAAVARGTSVYFPGRVVPMLPEVLSNGLCSLNPHVDRLCLVCEMRVSPGGKVTRARFFDAVMRSRARLTYERAAQLLDNEPGTEEERALTVILQPLNAVYDVLAAARQQRGAIDFDFPELKVVLNAAGEVDLLEPRERLRTHRIIEECMIAANVEAAKLLTRSRIPGLFRVHQAPAGDKLETLWEFLQTFDVPLPPIDNLKPRDFTRLLEEFADRPEAELVRQMVLRAMQQARYQPKNLGHFGLALSQYAHFTSPIRRYPDLLVHRAIKWVNKHGNFRGYTYDMADMTRLGELTSRAERRADEAVWDVEEQLKCAFMRERVGEHFNTLVTAVVPFGLFVRIPEFGIEGLVHVSALPRDYYHREGAGTALVGERTGHRFGLMSSLRVRVAGVNLEERKIDFVPENMLSDSSPARRRRNRGR